MTEAEKFVASCAKVADELGLLFANEPDEKVEASLAGMRQRLIGQFLEIFPKAAPEITAGVDSILLEIQKRRSELEFGVKIGGSPRELRG
jgi:acylphosphatase